MNAVNRIASLSSLGNPRERKSSIISDKEIPLSDVLGEQKIEYTKDNVISHLSGCLEWRITVLDEDEGVLEVPVEALKTFRVGVYVSTNQYTDSEESGVSVKYGAPIYLLEVTKGKTGGISSEAELRCPILLNGTRV